jgi:hypothetical protein
MEIIFFYSKKIHRIQNCYVHPVTMHQAHFLLGPGGRSTL